MTDKGGGISARDDGQWSDADLKRAMAAARESALASYRVEIAPDGTISIIVAGTSPKR